MKKYQEKLNFLLDKYQVGKKVTLKNCNCAEVDGQEIPLLSHRSERRFIELKKLVQDGTVKGISAFRISNITNKSVDLNKILYKELDLCMWILESKIASICTMRNGNVQNTIAKTESGVVCTIEIAATLDENLKTIDKHEIISERGIACDKVVDTQIMQNSIYLFGKEKKEFTDTDFELYGLESDEVAMVRHAFEIARDNNTEATLEADKMLGELIRKSEESANLCERMDV